MTEYPPAAIRALYDTIAATYPSAVFSGIQGDSAHTYGYHRGRNYIPASDYSVQMSDDKAGDGEACSALDVSLDDKDMVTVTQRLMDATLAGDPGILSCRSFFGTVDNQTVTGMDTRGRYYVTSDPSHLWHEHISIFRRWANDSNELQKLAAVICGESADDMWRQTRLVSSPDHPIDLDAGVWRPLSWDSWSPDDGSGGTSCVLPPAHRLFTQTVDMYVDGLPDDGHLYVRIQTLDRSGNQLALYKVAKLRATAGQGNFSYSRVGSVGDSTNLRVLVAASSPAIVSSAEWRVLSQ